MEKLGYKEALKYAMKLERHTNKSMGEYLGVTPSVVHTTLHDRCGMTMENFMRYCEALNMKVFVEWEDPSGRQAKVRFRIE